MIKKTISVILSLTLMLGTVGGFNCKSVKAYDFPTEYINGINYPISLSTGKDASGKLVFKDSKFLEYIKTATLDTGYFRGYNFDIDENGMLSQEESEYVDNIDIENREDIKSVEGIEAFINLKNIYASNSGVTYVDINLNNNLKGIFLTGCKVDQIHLEGHENLESLKIDGCCFSALDISNLTNPMFIGAGRQKLKSNQEFVDNRYRFCLKELNPNIDLSKVENVRVMGGKPDQINTVYDSETGTIWCSDIMDDISYDYVLGNRNTSFIDDIMEVSIELGVGKIEPLKPIKDKEPEADKGNAIYTGDIYKLRYDAILDRNLKNKLVDAPSDSEGKYYNWDSTNILDAIIEGDLPGYHFVGWFMDSQGKKRITDYTSYKDIYKTQYSGNSYKNVPKIYAKYEINVYKIKYKTKCKKKIKAKKNIKWGAKIKIPKKKLKKKGYKFKGWKLEGKKVTKKSRLNKETSDYAFSGSSTITLKAVWKKVKHKKHKKKNKRKKRK